MFNIHLSQHKKSNGQATYWSKQVQVVTGRRRPCKTLCPVVRLPAASDKLELSLWPEGRPIGQGKQASSKQFVPEACSC